MSDILKKPYEISIWKDVLDNSGNFKEKKVGIIGSHTMEAAFRCREPQFKRNINGTVQLIFTMYNKYYDIEQEAYVFNPYSDLLVNEAKIKIKYGKYKDANGEEKDSWYDLVIKNIQESSDKNTFTYTCESLPINELSKNGFGLEFRNELQNNAKTINQFAEAVLEDTDWRLEDTILLQQKVEEPAVELSVEAEFTAYDMENGEEEVTIKTGHTIYASYSSYNKDSKFIIFLYREDNNFTKDSSTRIINNAHCYYALNSEWNSNGAEWRNVKNQGVSTEYRGDFFVKKAISTYDEVLEKYVDVYLDGNGKQVYGYTKTDYKEPVIVKNLITNSPESFLTSYDADDVEYGWEGSSEGTVSYTFNPMLITSLREGGYKIDYLNNNADEVTILQFHHEYDTGKGEYKEAKILNTGIQDSLQEIDGFNPGEEYIFRLEGIYLGAYSRNIGGLLDPNTNFFKDVKVDKDGNLVNGDYYLKEATTGGGLKLIVAEYEIKDGRYNIIREYFSAELELAGTKKEDEVYYTTEATGSFNAGISYNTLLKQNIGIFLEDLATIAAEGDNYYAIKTAQFFKKETYVKDGETLTYYPDELTTDFDETVVETQYKYYYPAPKNYSECFEDDNKQATVVEADLFTVINYPSIELSYICDYTIYVTAFGSPSEENLKHRYISCNIYGKEGEEAKQLTIQKNLSFQQISVEDGLLVATFDIGRVPDWATSLNCVISLLTSEQIENITPVLESYNANLTEDDMVFLEETSNLTLQYSKNYEKIRTIEAAESNRFNILQQMSETFECWVGFKIDHEESGEIKIDEDGRPCKWVYFYDYLGDTIKYPGFKYGINLQSVQRTLDSNQITSKIYVKNGSNSVAQHGICSIADASGNPTGENFFYDFSYYINHDLLQYDEVIKDLYGAETDGGLSYYPKYKGYNTKQKEISAKKAEVDMAIIKMESTVKVLKEQTQETEKQIANQTEQLAAITGTNWDKNTKAEDVISALIQTLVIPLIILALDGINTINQSKLGSYETDLLLAKQRSAYLEEEFNDITKEKKKLNSEFYQKYARFIQEGTWTSNEYVDPELYYLDAQNVLSTSVSPKVTYTMNVIDISQQEGFENYDYEIGDHTFIEDTEFFGWVSTLDTDNNIIKTPYKEEVIVSEIVNYLDSPENNKFSIQNYKTQFEDLFQRITATTQSLQFASGAYNRAANSVNPDGTFDSDALQDSLLAQAFMLFNPENETVQWDSDGLKIIDKNNGSKIIKLSNGTISLTRDGGESWSTAIDANGIKIDLLSSGIINTDKVLIGNSENYAFRWDATGLNAYTKNDDVSYNYGKFVRFDQYGLYGYSKGNVFNPESLGDVEDNADFGLTWDGFFLKSKHDDPNDLGYIKIDSQDDFQVIGNDGKTVRVKIGLIDATNHIYGLRLFDNKNNPVVDTDSNGNISITGKITATSGVIGGWTINSGNLSSVDDATKEGIILDAANSQIYSNLYKDSSTGTGWMINNNEAIFNNITLRGSLKAAVLEYGEVQSIGGIMMVRPSATIEKLITMTNTTLLTIRIKLSNTSLFNDNDFCKLCVDAEANKNYVDAKGEVLYSGINSFCGTITLLSGTTDGANAEITFIDLTTSQKTFLETFNFEGAGIVDLGEVGSIGLGLNSSDNNALLVPNSFSVFSLENIDSDDSFKYLAPHIILGKIPNQEEIYGPIANTYGLYADSAYLKGDFITGDYSRKHLYMTGDQLGFFQEDEKIGVFFVKDTTTNNTSLLSDSRAGAINLTKYPNVNRGLGLTIKSHRTNAASVNDLLYYGIFNIWFEEEEEKIPILTLAAHPGLVSIAGNRSEFSAYVNGTLYLGDLYGYGTLGFGLIGPYISVGTDKEDPYICCGVVIETSDSQEEILYGLKADWVNVISSLTIGDIATFNSDKVTISATTNITNTLNITGPVNISATTNITNTLNITGPVNINGEQATFSYSYDDPVLGEDKGIVTLSELWFYFISQGYYLESFINTLGTAAEKDVAEITMSGATITGVYVKEKIPYIAGDGVMEIGQYIDFHAEGTLTDYDARISCDSSGNLSIKSNGKLSITNGSNTYITTNKTMNTNKTNCLHLQCPKGGAVVISNGTSGSSGNEGGSQTPANWENCLFRTGTSDAKAYCFGSWFLGTSTYITSDINLKYSIESYDNKYSLLFDNLKPIRYKYKNGTSNRYHTGFIAQDVEDAIIKAGLTNLDFAGFAKNYETETDSETGEEVQIERCYLRYEEFIALNTNEIQKLKKRVTELENQLSEFLNQQN